VRPRLVLLLALIAVAPLAVAGWLGARIVRDEQAVLQHEVRGLIVAQLRSVEASLAAAVGTFHDHVVAEMPEDASGPDVLRQRAWRSPYVVQYFRLDRGRLTFPPVATAGRLTPAEREALRRTREVWQSGALVAEALGDEKTRDPAEPTSGWYVGYWDNGLQWMVWRRRGDGLLVAEINRARFLADLVAALPETDAAEPQMVQARIRLVDNSGRPLYQWGGLKVDEETQPDVRLNPGAPLSAWRLEYYGGARALGRTVTRGLLLNVTIGLLVLAAVVAALAVYLYREQSRELREAAQRVTFVNQVSHELKTPLTSIRMYAELLEDELPDDDERPRRHLEVIVAESQRLSRLIANVLTFGRARRGRLRLHRQPAVADDVVRKTLDRFRPALLAQGMEVSFAAGASRKAEMDTDILEQVLGNVVSNAEKYAAGGGRLDVTTRQADGRVEVIVADHGPGIPERERQRIFDPFYRIGNALTEGVSGTGIGLTISRELARLHGGDLVLVPSAEGACFRLTLSCPIVQEATS
jgi:signal transduction histidine kinase